MDLIPDESSDDGTAPLLPHQNTAVPLPPAAVANSTNYLPPTATPTPLNTDPTNTAAQAPLAADATSNNTTPPADPPTAQGAPAANIPPPAVPAGPPPASQAPVTPPAPATAAPTNPLPTTSLPMGPPSAAASSFTHPTNPTTTVPPLPIGQVPANLGGQSSGNWSNWTPNTTTPLTTSAAAPPTQFHSIATPTAATPDQELLIWKSKCKEAEWKVQELTKEKEDLKRKADIAKEKENKLAKLAQEFTIKFQQAQQLTEEPTSTRSTEDWSKGDNYWWGTPTKAEADTKPEPESPRNWGGSYFSSTKNWTKPKRAKQDPRKATEFIKTDWDVLDPTSLLLVGPPQAADTEYTDFINKTNSAATVPSLTFTLTMSSSRPTKQDRETLMISVAY